MGPEPAPKPLKRPGWRPGSKALKGWARCGAMARVQVRSRPVGGGPGPVSHRGSGWHLEAAAGRDLPLGRGVIRTQLASELSCLTGTPLTAGHRVTRSMQPRCDLASFK